MKVVTVGIDASVIDVSDAVKCASTDEDVVKVSGMNRWKRHPAAEGGVEELGKMHAWAFVLGWHRGANGDFEEKMCYNVAFKSDLKAQNTSLNSNNWKLGGVFIISISFYRF